MSDIADVVSKPPIFVSPTTSEISVRQDCEVIAERRGAVSTDLTGCNSVNQNAVPCENGGSIHGQKGFVYLGERGRGKTGRLEIHSILSLVAWIPEPSASKCLCSGVPNSTFPHQLSSVSPVLSDSSGDSHWGRSVTDTRAVFIIPLLIANNYFKYGERIAQPIDSSIDS